MKTGDKILAYCTKPRTAQELATHCKVQRSSIYSALGRLQMKGILTRLGDGTERATYVLNEPSLTKMNDYENLVIKHAHNPFGLQP
jgi:predicted transcriptional regulator